MRARRRTLVGESLLTDETLRKLIEEINRVNGAILQKNSPVDVQKLNALDYLRTAIRYALPYVEETRRG
jgi:hypothetical protein